MKKILLSLFVMSSSIYFLNGMEHTLNEIPAENDWVVTQINDIFETPQGNQIKRICTLRGDTVIQIVCTSAKGFAGLKPDEIFQQFAAWKKISESQVITQP